MPIHMEKDHDGQDKRRPQPNGPQPNDNQRKGRNPLIAFLPIIIMYFVKNPRQAILLLIVGGLIYYFTGGGSNLLNFNEGQQDANFSFGATLDEEVYDEAMVYASLANSSKNSLPDQVSLLQYAPRRLNQGRQGSCVGWSSAYAAQTILFSQASGQDPDQIALSPSFLYNQIALRGCQGSYLQRAMENMKSVGGLPFSQFGYDESSCQTQPNYNQKQSASQFRIRGANRLTLNHNNYKVDMGAIKQHLAAGAPVVIGMQVGGTFMRGMYGTEVWRPTSRDKSLMGFSGHAMTVIGYDDNKSGGAFQIMNSWGDRWGKDGVGWVTYRDFDYFVKEAYGLHPMGRAKDQNNDNTTTTTKDEGKLAVRLGLVDTLGEANIPLRQVGDVVFRTQSPIRIGDKFKVEVTNSVPCYTYIFGQDVDGSSYTLFPYTEKHSAYCGITGTRVFPRDYSMKADDVGSRDKIAVVVSKVELNYEAVKELMNRSRKASYQGKLYDALGNQAITNVQFAADKTIDLLAETGDKNCIGIVIEFDKR